MDDPGGLRDDVTPDTARSSAAPPTLPGPLPQRSPSAAWPTVLGIIAIVWACLTLLGAVCTVPAMSLSPSLSATTRAGQVPVPEQAPFGMSPYALAGISAIIAMMLFITGNGLRYRRHWSVRLARIWAVIERWAARHGRSSRPQVNLRQPANRLASARGPASWRVCWWWAYAADSCSAAGCRSCFSAGLPGAASAPRSPNGSDPCSAKRAATGCGTFPRDDVPNAARRSRRAISSSPRIAFASAALTATSPTTARVRRDTSTPWPSNAYPAGVTSIWTK